MTASGRIESGCRRRERTGAARGTFSSLTVALLCLCSLLGVSAGADGPPSIVLLFADDLGYGTISSYNGDVIEWHI